MPDDAMFRPPINRAMKTLDRAFFKKTVPTSAARIFKQKDISTCKKELESAKDALVLPRFLTIVNDPVEETARAGGKCILLKPEVRHDDSQTWSPKLRDLQQNGTVGVIPYDLHLNYDFWSHSEIMDAILPEEIDNHDPPTGFTLIGHVAHLNLRDHYLPWKYIIAKVLADKNPTVRTVINKIERVGEADPYRTFQYEVLHGPDDMCVEVHEQGCVFKFDFAKVYWNSRLHTEHERLVTIFKEGEAVADVMAGIGPFAVPAGKKKVFAWANDLNPEGYAALRETIKGNKTGDFVRPFNEDGAKFIKTAAAELLKTQHSVTIKTRKDIKTARSARTKPDAPKAGATHEPQPSQTLTQPRFFNHFVMNLPASALSFLPAFVGIYAQPAFKALSSEEREKIPMPLVHVYCFSSKSDDNVAQTAEICEEISTFLGTQITPETPETTVWDVRDVAPKKRMFCASFRLPREVAFREV
ncbi:guanine-N(1)--methyltransferas-like protein [Lophium mytilinum]|uniref:tRNA (guanine(37)-N1)-methyltransferase n=1 Tax=Lophium mytilinum TaxID=390894 RepID=A0A6A6R436_9PEZI|nr:guanine-N(1)--methyltransferas-like protein [Lophium mytilinum]